MRMPNVASFRWKRIKAGDNRGGAWIMKCHGSELEIRLYNVEPPRLFACEGSACDLSGIESEWETRFRAPGNVKGTVFSADRVAGAGVW